MVKTITAKSGRPRDAQVDERILNATAALLAENGFARLSVDAVAARPGVGKATIYRRWRSRSELLLAAMSRIEETPDFDESDDLEADLRVLLHWLADHFVHTQAAEIMPLLVAEARFDPALGQLTHTISERGRDIFRRILTNADRRGLLVDGVDLEVVIDMLIAPIFIRKLVSGAPIDTCVTDQAIDMLLRGIIKH